MWIKILVSKKVSGKYSQNYLDKAKQSATNALKTTFKKKYFKKKHKNLVIWLAIKSLIKLQVLHCEVMTASQIDKKLIELPKERHISPEKRQHIIDELRLI